MQKLFIITLLILLCFNAYPQWDRQVTPDDPLQNYNLNSIHFINENLGWAAGTGGKILHTTNGGLQWQFQSSNTTYDLNSIFFIDSRTGFCAGSSGLILKTVNGGTSWFISYNFSSVLNDPEADLNIMGYNALFFTDALHGFAVGKYQPGGMLFGYSKLFTFTTNGGISWESNAGPAGGDDIIMDVFFLDNDNGWASTYNVDGIGHISKTTDGGHNWTDISPDGMIEYKSFKLYFIDINTGWLSGYGFTGGVVYKTEDGGNTWTDQDIYLNPGNPDIQFLDSQNGFTLGNYYANGYSGDVISRIFKTINSGNTWSYTDIEGRLNSISFIDKYTGWAAGDDRTIYKYYNPRIISYWKLDELIPGSYSDLTGVQDAVGVISPISSEGIVDGAQSFNGSTTKVDVPSNSTLDIPANGSFSVEFWYKGSTVPSTAKVAVGRFISNTGARWWVGLNAVDGKARFYMAGGGLSAAVNGTVITDGNWHHVAATRNGLTGTLKIYVDGVLKSTAIKRFTLDFASPSANLNIGWFSFQSANSLAGTLDEIAFYGNELSPADIVKHHSSGLAGLPYDINFNVNGSIPPVIISTPVTTAYRGEVYKYDIDATGSPLMTYTLTTFPAGMTINNITGLIEWIPSETGSYNVSVKVSNWINPDAVQTFSINVEEGIQVCPSNLISYWKLDEGEESTYTDQLNMNIAYPGTIAPVPVEGIVGGAQNFNGSTTKVDVPSNSTLDIPANGSFSVEFWYKGSTVPSTAKVAVGRFISNNGARWWVGLNAADGKARFYMAGGGLSAAVNGTVITDGNWHHVAATRNGITGTLKIYVDGVLRSTAIKRFILDFSSPSANLNIGWFSFQSANSLAGTLDEIAFYNNEISSGQIQSDYTKGLSGLAYCRSLYKSAENLTESETIPAEYKLFQNYPNPFNPHTIIRFSIPESRRVRLEIFNSLGEKISELVNQEYQAGSYEVNFNGGNLPSGIYFYKIEAGQFRAIKKFLLLK